MVEKSKRITIEISTETYERICGIKTSLEAIFGVSVSFDKALKVLCEPKLIDYSEMLWKKIVQTEPQVVEDTNFEQKSENETDEAIR